MFIKVLDKYFTKKDARDFADCVSDFFSYGIYVEKDKIKEAYEILRRYFGEEDARGTLECLLEIFTVHRYHYYRGDEFYEDMEENNDVTSEDVKAMVEEVITGRS